MTTRKLLSLKAWLLIALLISASMFTPMAAWGSPTDADFTLRSIDGATISSAALRGKVVVLAIGASWLPLSRKQVESVQKLADDYSRQDVEVFWVSTDSESPKSKNYASDDQLRAFAGKYNLKIKVLRDPDGAVSKQLGANQVPSVIIIDKQGQISGGLVGGLDPQGNLAEQLSTRLNKLL